VKVNLFQGLSKHQAMKTYWGSGYIVLRIRNTALDGIVQLATRSGCFTPGKSPRYPVNRGLGKPQSRSGHSSGELLGRSVIY
jgi:hypothetical protein